MKKRYLIGVSAAAVTLALSYVLFVWLNSTPLPSVSRYTYTVVNVYPHDEDAFTQGLVYENGFLYEGTGLYGRSEERV